MPRVISHSQEQSAHNLLSSLQRSSRCGISDQESNLREMGIYWGKLFAAIVILCDLGLVLQNQNRMKDQQLYNLIKKAVRQRKNIPHHSQTKTFAERYCQTQLKRKIYNSRDKKMGNIMKNFNRLQTYYDLPELVKEIRQIKSREIQQTRMKSMKKIDFAEQPLDQPKMLQSKSFSNLKNLRSSIENQYSKMVLDRIQNENCWSSQDLKNNSTFHLINLEQVLRNSTQDNISSNRKMFDHLQRFLKNQKAYIAEEQTQSYNKMQANAEEKRQITQYLHKVSSYLQIILEKEHKNKWKRKRNSSIFKPRNLLANQNTKSQYSIARPYKNAPLLKQTLTNVQCIQTLKQQTRMIKQDSKKSKRPKYLIKKPNSNLYGQAPLKQSTKQSTRVTRVSNSRFKQLSNNLTSFINPNESTELIRNQSSLIKQNFTFRRRSIKQKIIKKLDKFIGEIDDETFTSKKENGYYNHEINKLESNFKKMFARYRKATLADEKEIEDLKRLAQEFSVMTPTRKNNQHDSDSSFTSQHRLSGKDLSDNPGYGYRNCSKNGADLFHIQNL